MSWLTFHSGGIVVKKVSVDKEVDCLSHLRPFHKLQASVLVCDKVKVTYLVLV